MRTYLAFSAGWALGLSAFAQTGFYQLTSGTTEDLYEVQYWFNDIIVCGSNGYVGRSVNNGTSWTVENTNSTRTLYGFKSATGGELFLVGDSGTFLAWNGLSAYTYRGPAGVTVPLMGTFSNLGGNAHVVGGGGLVMTTASAGTTWSTSNSGTTADLYDASGDHVNGVAVGANGTIIRSTSSATNWTLVPSGTTNTLRGVHYKNGATGYIVGDNGTILISTPAANGAAWTAVNSGVTRNLNAVFAVPFGLAYACGDGGLILRSADHGNTWHQLLSPTTEDLLDVMANNNNGNTVYISGRNGTILKATDAGGSPVGLAELLAPVPLQVLAMPSVTSGPARIQVTLQQPALVQLALIDGIGRTVLVRSLGMLPSGGSRTDLDMDALPAGTYTYRVSTMGHQADGRLVLVR